jgi:hypothetical protein
MTNFHSIILANEKISRQDLKKYNKFDFELDSIKLSHLSIFKNSGTDGTLLVASEDLNSNYAEDLELQNFRKIVLGRRTKGALATLALSLKFLPENVPIVVCSIHHFLNDGLTEFVKNMEKLNAAAGVVTFASEDKSFSYALISENRIVELSEDEKISSTATAGIFFFKNKEFIFNAIQWSMGFGLRSGENFYVAPALNYFITEGLPVHPFMIRRPEYTRFSNASEANVLRSK